MVARLTERPVLTAFVLALVLRVGLVLGTIAITDNALIPDEHQYIDLADLAADGRLDQQSWDGYAAPLWASIRAFMLPFTWLADLTGHTRASGALLATLFGALTVAFTTMLARRLMTSGWALVVGIAAAAWPSQALWSSVVLRESLVWCCLAGIAVVVASSGRATSGRRLLGSIGAVALALLVLGYTREHIAVVAAWGLPMAALLVPTAQRLRLVLGSVAIALVMPFAAGLGPGGIGLVDHWLPNIAVYRVNRSLEASSAFVDQGKVVTPPTSSDPSGSTATTAATTTTIVTQAQQRITRDRLGGVYVVDDSTGSNIRAVPRGLSAFFVRPFPWDPGSGFDSLFAKVENLLWIGLYPIAVVGIWVHRRRREVLAFPLLMIAGVSLASAVAEGNLGTAFRHRGQIGWAVLLFATLGVRELAVVVQNRAVVRPNAGDPAIAT